MQMTCFTKHSGRLVGRQRQYEAHGFVRTIESTHGLDVAIVLSLAMTTESHVLASNADTISGLGLY